MQTVLPALIAVVGTLLGSIITYRFQQNSFDRAERLSIMKQLRLERVALYSDFAGAITEFRRAEHDWWNVRSVHPEGAGTHEAQLESYRLRGIALHALLRVQLIAPGEELLSGARKAYDLTTVIHEAGTAGELSTRGKDARDALEGFIALASEDIVQEPVSRPRSLPQWTRPRASSTP